MSEIAIKSGIVSHDRGWDMGFHAHDDAEFSVVLEGQGMVQAGELTLPIAAGHVVLIPPCLPHRFWSVTPIRFGVFQANRMTPSLLQLFGRLALPGKLSLVALPRSELDMYETLYRSFLKIASRPLADRADCYGTWTRVLLLFLLQHASRTDHAASVPDAADYIRGNLNRDIRVAELAKRTKLSESAFRSAFTAAYGMSPKQYQQQCRLTEAKWLLRSSDKPIKQIAEAVGFASVHSFSRWFMLQEGAAASDWRKEQQADLLS
ncbi:hypothetical protein SD70_13205 [Gordoniibacillus kamchatkensis]|uniref:HTH araC/xylS-type domain-containing protein n=1 Tax=Gordoniibacillus kamchatkensis TaxID=1590651 RepID=A0ABR5AHI4_9BACL|nr:AraC family transcriptional regulator [Paenibacillus sp. VKM B-2647]KIL40515.1 hypothetical protein SD70_13205 [Paenibacillus sp. VKM B-2647]